MSVIYSENIDKNTEENKNYRKVVYTHEGGIQFVLMNLKPGCEIGMEKHDNLDQFIKIENGEGEANIDKDGEIKVYKLSEGYGIIIPSGTNHNIKNTGKTELKLYTIYTKPEHKPNLIQEQKGGYLHKYMKYKMKYFNLLNKIKKN